MTEIQDIEQKLINSFKRVKRDIYELQAKSINVEKLNSTLETSFGDIKKQLQTLKEVQNAQLEQMLVINKEVGSIKNELYKTREIFVTREEALILNNKLERVLALEKNFKQINEKEPLRNDIEKVNKTNSVQNEQKRGFFRKKIDEVIDILAEDEE